MALLATRAATAAGLDPIPGSPGLPILGRTLDMLNGRWMTDDSFYRTYGSVYFSRAVGQTFVVAADPDAVAVVLANKEKSFASGPGWSFFIGPFFERGLMLLDGEEHHRHRHIMQQAFVRPRLESYLAGLQTTSAEAIAAWPRGEIKLSPAVRNLGLEIATRTFMGLPAGLEAREVMQDFEACVRAGTSVVRRPVPGLRWSRGLAARARLEEYLLPVIRAARDAEGDTLLHGLCQARGEDGERFAERDVLNHMIFLLMAAHDTSTTTITTMAYHLAKHSEWQERCREESLALGDAPTLADLDSLTSLDLVMKESMRMISPVPALARRAIRDTELLGRFVPRGSLVTVPIQHLHMREELWPEPERFDPERFAADRREDQVHRHAYLPFGGGVHKCIGMFFAGMEVKSVVHRMLREFRWSVPDGYVMPVDRLSLPKPKDGLPVHLAPL
ncbi:cytochrome P450 [Nocardioides daejeonensis]|uniref:cytochrome P450 n=1 Tax=Nocardioides daejeonensis TaxID=1046556 RepID=UPI000D74D9B3|nr:cytochrome P450 [Nocardioides daejeonensis]